MLTVLVIEYAVVLLLLQADEISMNIYYSGKRSRARVAIVRKVYVSIYVPNPCICHVLLAHELLQLLVKPLSRKTG